MAHIKSRKHPIARRLNCSVAVAAAVMALPAYAQQTDDAAKQAGTLPQITVQGDVPYKADAVSSPKFTQPLVDTTQTVSIIKKEVIQDQGATTLTEALRSVPGVGTFYAGENGNTSTGDAIYMRGFDTSNSIYVDGVRDLGSISRDIFNVEQVEVTKGPSSTDYGRSAPSGAINLVTKQPTLTDATSASVGFGSGSYKRTAVDLNKALTGMEGTAIRLNAMVQDAGVAGRDEVENDRWAVAPSIAFGLNSPTRTYLNFLHVKQNNVPDGGVYTIGLPGFGSPDPARPYLGNAPKVDSSNFYGTRSDRDDVTADMATLRFEHDISADTTIRNTTRWGRTKQDYLLTSFMAAGSGANQILTPSATDPSTWTMARNINTKDQVNTIITNQTNLTTSFATGSIKHDLSAGFELTREEQESYTRATTGTVPRVSVYDPDSSISLPDYNRTGAFGKGSTDTIAAYVFDTLKFNDQWQANLGLRIDHYKTRYNAVAACGGRGPACGSNPTGTLMSSADHLKASDNVVSWKTGLLYKPAPNGSIYVNYAVSKQPPGGSNFQLSTSDNSANNANMDPQEAKTAEIGTKWDLLNKRLLLTAAIFRTDVENEIFENDDGTFDQTGKKRVKGFELSASGQITRDWSVIAGYTYQDSEIVKGDPLTNDDSDGLTYTPKDSFSLWTTYQLPRGFTVGGGARYSGGLKRGSDGAVGTPNFTDSYWVYDAMATYRLSKNVDLQLNIYNLFDKEYVAAINKSGYRYFPGIERSARLTANIRF
ncbi:catecholate siderophore receptor Fiu [Oxalicibacterium solurbis]|uniref:Catecholate siderophore receptor Fiu n=1 Tax=Oxalicibacterium solurbis TaxID=69280 RepID=A0A8J3B1W3_9BURK|nr:catecholate siderophore receptor Fiu [Oxalicibacterium solurbis]GGI55077.1 catecholate siderophore receptor Fiu [Oxalicibacterium solurbis]